jgi:ABC-type transport system substrate-binding protein
MKSKKLFLFVSLIIVFSFVLAACGPAETPATETTTEETTSETTGAEAPVGRAEVIRFPLLADITSTNIWNLWDDAGASYWNYAPLGNQWPTLFALSDVRYDWVPGTAADFPTEPVVETIDGVDYYTATVTLKNDLVWSDGSPITSADVVFTVNAALAFNLLGNWIGAYDPSYLDHVEAVDDYTIKYYFLTSPGLPIWQYGALTGPFVSSTYWTPLVQPLLDQLAALDPAAETYATDLADLVAQLESIDPAGEPTFGIYKLDQWEAGAYVRTVVNENNYFIGLHIEEYANGAYREYLDSGYEFVAYGEPTGDTVLSYQAGPYFDSALYTLYDVDTAVLALQNNDIDVMLNPSGLPAGFIQQLQSDPSITIVSNEQNGFRYMGFNFARAYWQGAAGAALRQAIACQLDLDFLTTNVLQGQVFPQYTLVPPGNAAWFNPEVPVYCQGMTTQERINEAVRILTDAGFTWTTAPAWNENRGGSVEYGEGLTMPDGTVVPEMTLMAPNAGYDPLRATSAVYIEQWMRQLGIPVVAELTNFNNITNAVYGTGEWDIFILGWGLSAFPGYLCSFFGNGDPTLNSYSYESVELQTLCDEWYANPDLESSHQQARDIQTLLATDLPYITLFTNPLYDAFRNVTYPYTEVLDGLAAGLYGAPTIAMPAAQ